MEKIIPRWEYRVFAEDLGAVEGKIREHEVTRVKESAEDYIVCRSSGNNVKVRDGLLDIKQLENTNEDTLEQWMPVMNDAPKSIGRRSGWRCSMAARTRSLEVMMGL